MLCGSLAFNSVCLINIQGSWQHGFDTAAYYHAQKDKMGSIYANVMSPVKPEVHNVATRGGLSHGHRQHVQKVWDVMLIIILRIFLGHWRR